MKRSAILSIPAALGLFIALAAPQNSHHFPTPPESMDSENKTQPPEPQTRHIDLAQVQKDADDLARTAQTIPSDVSSIRQGMLPKDVVEKLKRIEKLSKRLCNELNP